MIIVINILHFVKENVTTVHAYESRLVITYSFQSVSRGPSCGFVIKRKKLVAIVRSVIFLSHKTCQSLLASSTVFTMLAVIRKLSLGLVFVLGHKWRAT